MPISPLQVKSTLLVSPVNNASSDIMKLKVSDAIMWYWLLKVNKQPALHKLHTYPHIALLDWILSFQTGSLPGTGTSHCLSSSLLLESEHSSPPSPHCHHAASGSGGEMSPWPQQKRSPPLPTNLFGFQDA